MTLAELLQSIQGRDTVPAFGVTVAKHYVQGIVGCLDGSGLCPKDIFKLGSNDEWTKEIADAAERLVYADPSTRDGSFLQKSIREGTDITPASVLEYDTVITSRNKDRDGDVLEPKGFRVDPSMPLLWQHVQFSPIGKMVKVLKHDDNSIVVRNAIADTPLGRDSATLVKFGALRTSQGFKPEEYEPLGFKKLKDGTEAVAGWHFKTGDIFENSLVSIPANSDARVIATYEKSMFDGLCTAFSRGALKTDLVQHYAKSLYSKRQVLGKGADFTAKGMDSDGDEDGSDDMEKKKCPKCDTGYYNDKGECPCGNKMKGLDGSQIEQIAELVVKKMSLAGQGKPAHTPAQPSDELDQVKKDLITLGDVDISTKMLGMDRELEGSFEWIREKLRGSAKAYLTAKGIDVDGYTTVGATFMDSAIICCEKWTGTDYDTKCYRVNWKTNDMGRPLWDGEPKPVDVKPTIVEKQLSRERETDQLTPDRIAKFIAAKSLGDEAWMKAVGEIAKIQEFAKSQATVKELAAMVSG